MSYTYTRFKTLRQGQTLFLLCWAAYTCAYVGRYNYSAVMPAILAEGSLGLTQAGTVSTVYFVLYAVGQVIGGILCQKISPYSMVFSGLALYVYLLFRHGVHAGALHGDFLGRQRTVSGCGMAADCSAVCRMHAAGTAEKRLRGYQFHNACGYSDFLWYQCAAACSQRMANGVCELRGDFACDGYVYLFTRSMRTPLKHKRTTAVLSARDEKEKSSGRRRFCKAAALRPGRAAVSRDAAWRAEGWSDQLGAKHDPEQF